MPAGATFGLILVAVLLGIVLLLVRVPGASSHLWFFKWFIGVVQSSLDYWGASQRLADSNKMFVRLLALSSVLSADRDSLRDHRKSVTLFIEDAFRTAFPSDKWNAEDQRVITTAYVFLISHQEIFDVVKDIQEGPANIDARKATTLVIDVVGEFLNLQDKLGQEYFQHLIYGINKCLIIIRDHGTDAKTLKKVTSTLFRVYKITKAYRHRRGLQNLTEVELYAKINSVLRTASDLNKSD